jgi:hypothetical protein
MLRDASSHFQSLLVELESLDQKKPVDADIRTRKSEILQLILQLFATKLETRREAQGPTV